MKTIICSINFQMGEFYGEQGSIFKDFLLPIATLILGFFLNIIYEKIKESKRLKMLRLEFEIEINALIIPLEEQSKEFDSLVKKIRSNDLKNFGLQININLEGAIDKYNQFKSADLIKALKSKNIAERKVMANIYNLRQHIILIEKHIKTSPSQLIKTLENINASKNSNSQLINQLFLTIVGFLNSNHEPTEFKKELVRILEFHQLEAKNFKLLFGEESLIMPLSDMMIKYPKAPIFEHIKPIIFQCQRNFKNIKEEQTFAAEYFDQLHHSFIQSTDDIKEMITKMGLLSQS